MIICSIDPGSEGSFAIINSETKQLLHVVDFDFMDLGFKNYKVFDPMQMICLCEEEGVKKIFIEKVGAIKGQGMSSAFTFGTRLGEVLSAARYITEDITLITPMKWKNAVGLTGADKKQSAVLCEKLYPDSDFFSRPKQRGTGKVYLDGRADAVLIGLAAVKLGYV